MLGDRSHQLHFDLVDPVGASGAGLAARGEEAVVVKLPADESVGGGEVTFQGSPIPKPAESS